MQCKPKQNTSSMNH